MTNRWVCLLRGINVGGNNKLKMAEFRQVLAGLGGTRVATYIQSGNAVFDYPSTVADELANQIAEGISTKAGFIVPDIFVLPAARLDSIEANCPYPTTGDPKLLHVYFLHKPRPLDPSTVETLAAEGEKLTIIDDVAYFQAPNGLSRSKLAAKLPSLIAESYTARNWRTFTKMVELAAS